ncbi:unnamed protein product [Symbiodinium microadriaticum]|nr:unnamed protein product [Symbiodinium microadriaticum]
MAENEAEGPFPEGVDLDGLAKAWGNDSRVREPLLRNGTLFQWPSKQTCGIVSFASLAMNYAVLDHLLDIWCCQVTAAKSIYIPHAKQQDARLRMLFEKMSQFWEPSHSKRKKTKAEQKQEDEEETVASEDFAREPSEEPDEHARASMDAYMSALQHRSPQAAELDSLSHAAAGEDEEALAYALGTDSKQTCTPVECMKTGLSEDFQALALSKGARTMKDSVVIELGDSPVPAAPSMPSTRLPGLATSARDRLDRLRSEILRRQAARACARPLKASDSGRGILLDSLDTCPVNMSPIAKNLQSKFEEAMDCLDLVSPTKPASPEAVKGPEFMDEKQKVAEPASPEAVKGPEFMDEKHKVAEPAAPEAVKGPEFEKQKPEAVKGPELEDDLFFDESSIRRTDQVQLREDLAADCKDKAKGSEPEEDEGSDGDVPVMKKPAMRKKQATSTAEPAKPKTKAKAKGKGKAKAKAKAKAKGTDAKSSKPKDAKGNDAESSPKDAEGNDAESSMEAPGSPSNEVDQELEAELERQMMADAKPDALVETGARSTRPVVRKRASPDDDDHDQPKPPRKRREGPNKTFAGRVLPKEVFAKQRFESIRDAYQLYCLPRLKKPSTHADAFWKHCFELVGPGKKVDGLALKKICKERAESFMCLESIQSASSVLGWFSCCAEKFVLVVLSVLFIGLVALCSDSLRFPH